MQVYASAKHLHPDLLSSYCLISHKNPFIRRKKSKIIVDVIKSQ